MRITIARRRLLEALELARKWVTPVKDRPSTAAAQLTAEGYLAWLHRSDGDRVAALALDATIARSGQVVVNAQALYRIAKTLRSTTLELEAHPEDSLGTSPYLEVRAAAARYVLVGCGLLDPSPEDPAVKATPLVESLPASSLRWLLGATVYAAGAPDESSTDCIELLADHGALRAIATDGHRAAIADLVHAGVHDLEAPTYLPADTAARLAALKEECMVSVARSADKRLRIELGTTAHLSCRTLDRTYPDVSRVVRELDAGEEIVAQREQLLAALDRATAVLGSSPVTLAAGDDQVTVSGRTEDGAQIVEHFPARAAGPARGIALNPSYATDALRALTSSEVSLRIGEHSLTVRPVLQDDMTQRQISVVMEVRTDEPEIAAPAPDPEPEAPATPTKRSKKPKA